MTYLSRFQKFIEAHRIIPVLAVLAFALAVSGASAHAQTPMPTLALQADVLTSGLFTGANIILLALGGIVFLLVGLAFGGKILDAIRNMVQGLRIG